MSGYLEKLRSVGHLRAKGQAQVRRLTEGGQARGYEVEYGDGSTEAIVRPGTVSKKFSISRMEESNE
jgi:hypothetical protein